MKTLTIKNNSFYEFVKKYLIDERFSDLQINRESRYNLMAEILHQSSHEIFPVIVRPSFLIDNNIQLGDMVLFILQETTNITRREIESSLKYVLQNNDDISYKLTYIKQNNGN